MDRKTLFRVSSNSTEEDRFKSSNQIYIFLIVLLVLLTMLPSEFANYCTLKSQRLVLKVLAIKIGISYAMKEVTKFYQIYFFM